MLRSNLIFTFNLSFHQGTCFVRVIISIIRFYRKKVETKIFSNFKIMIPFPFQLSKSVFLNLFQCTFREHNRIFDYHSSRNDFLAKISIHFLRDNFHIFECIENGRVSSFPKQNDTNCETFET